MWHLNVLGLPQITVRYDRKRSTIRITNEKLNRYVVLLLPGSSAGVVFEGEKRSDLVMQQMTITERISAI